MEVKTFYSDFLNVNSYIVIADDDKSALIIDPFEDIEIKKSILNLDLKYCVNTHGHFDHISGNKWIKKNTSALVVIGSRDAPMLIDPMKNLSGVFGFPEKAPPADILIEKEPFFISLNEIKFEIFLFPGHTEGGIALYHKESKVMFSGDFIFSDTVGRMDFPGGNRTKMKNSLKRIQGFTDDVKIFPGHGEPFFLKDLKRNFLQLIMEDL